MLLAADTSAVPPESTISLRTSWRSSGRYHARGRGNEAPAESETGQGLVLSSHNEKTRENSQCRPEAPLGVNLMEAERGPK